MREAELDANARGKTNVAGRYFNAAGIALRQCLFVASSLLRRCFFAAFSLLFPYPAVCGVKYPGFKLVANPTSMDGHALDT
jgi:hypothetical protein